MKRHYYGRLILTVIGLMLLTIAVWVSLPLAQYPPQEDVSLPAEVQADLASVVPPQAVKSSACPTCYTHACKGCYDIFEEVPGTGITLTRTIPNPAPLEPGESIRPAIDPETGLPIWYIGHQPYVGPTDEEPFSPVFSVPQITLRRIQARHHREVFGVPGVTAFGIGAKGFTVLIEPQYFAKSANQIPSTIEGIPVTADVGGPFVTAAHATTQYRPVPTSASVGRVLPGNEPKEGTTGPILFAMRQQEVNVVSYIR